MTLLIFKIIHFVFLISWMAGMFYLGRMFVYHREAFELPDKAIAKVHIDLISLMEKRVYTIIMNPAMMITWIAGLAMIYIYGWEWFKLNTWLHYKLFFLLVLTVYHMHSKHTMFALQKGILPMSSMSFRLYNEVPTVVMIIIVSLAVLKNMTNPFILIGTVLAIIILLVTFTRLYKVIRDRNAKI